MARSSSSHKASPSRGVGERSVGGRDPFARQNDDVMPDRVDGADSLGHESRKDDVEREISVFDEEPALEVEGLDEEEEVEDLVDILDEASLSDAIDESADDVVDAYGDVGPVEERENETVEGTGEESDESPDEPAVSRSPRGRGRRH